MTESAKSPARYLAWLYSPPPQQSVLAALYEIESEITGSLRPGLDHHVAHVRLQWWAEECKRCAQGQPVHPLTRELIKAYGSDSAPLAGISGFVDTTVWDLAKATFETRKELSAYCERWAAAMFEPVAATAVDPTLTDPAGTSSTSHWRKLGAALREVELLVNLAHEAHAGRLRVPLDELERAGVDMNSLAKLPWPAALTTLLCERHEALRVTIAKGLSDLGRGQTHLRGLIVWSALMWRLSRRAQRALPNTIPPRRYHALADGWQAWRAAQRATAGNLRLS